MVFENPKFQGSAGFKISPDPGVAENGEAFYN